MGRMGRMWGGYNTSFLDEGAKGRMGRISYTVSNFGEFMKNDFGMLRKQMPMLNNEYIFNLSCIFNKFSNSTQALSLILLLWFVSALCPLQGA